MDAATRRLVRTRAGDRCEYCRIHQRTSTFAHHIEHIIARQHGGANSADNLALACNLCNASKGPNLTGIDPATGSLTPLFHPRRDAWSDHFVLDGPRIVGETAVGRTTVRVLAIDDARRVITRAGLIAVGLFP